MSNPTYTDNQVPIGSRVETVKTGGGAGTSIGAYIFENITLNRPGRVVERYNEIGAGGVAGDGSGWALVHGFPTGTAVLQVATATTRIPPLGAWFSDTFDGSTAGSAEQWVITDLGQPFEQQGYFKCNVSIRLSPTPPTS